MEDATFSYFGITGGGDVRYKGYEKDYNDGVRYMMKPIFQNLQKTSTIIE
jgi:hypothetical protein